MSRVKPELISFTGGEVSVRTLARADLDNYKRMAEVMENVFPDIQGGMSKAPGTIYVAAAPDPNAVLRPFEFSINDNLVMVLSNAQFRLIDNLSYLQTGGAAATIGSISDESSAPSSGGGSAPDINYVFDIDLDFNYWEIGAA